MMKATYVPVALVLALAAAGAAPASAVPQAPAPSAAPAAASSPAGSTRALLDRHVAWLGGAERLRAVEDLHASGILSASGLSGSFEVLARRDGYQLTRYDLGVVTGAEGFGPEGGWAVNESGQVEPMGEDELVRGRADLARTFFVPVLAGGDAWEDLGTEPKAGREWPVLRHTRPDGDTWDLFLDPADGAETWAREHRDTRTVWHRFSDWRPVAGVRMPFRHETFHENPDRDEVFVWNSVEANTGLAPEAFARPSASRKVWTLAGGAAATDWIPMDLYLGSYIYLQGTVNGIATDVVLDSGAGMTVLDRPVAEAAGLETAGNVAAQGTGGETTASFAKGVDLTVGGLSFHGLTAAVLDLGPVAGRLGRPLPVILGKEAFQALVVEVDYPGRRLRFHDPSRFEYQGSGHPVRIVAAEDGQRNVEAQVEDLPPALFGLDTGSGKTVDLFRAYTDDHALLEGRRPLSEALSGGVGGVTVSKVGTLKTFTFAGYVLHDVPVGFHREAVGAFDTRRSAGNLGAGILSRFRVIFDYGQDRLLVEPGEGWGSRPFDRNRTGLSLQAAGDGGCEVLLVAPGSPAEKAGIVKGDRVIAVDGSPLGADYRQRLLELSRRAPGTEVRVELAGGTVKGLVLADYY